MGTTKEILDNKGNRRLGKNQICGTTRMTAVETREENISHNSRETFDSVLLGKTETASLMATSMSPTYDWRIKKHPNQCIGCRIVVEATVS